MSDTPAFGMSGRLDDEARPAERPRVVPEDADVMQKGPRTTALDLVLADLASEVPATELLLPVPKRPRYSVRYLADIDGDDVDSWRKRATIKPARGDRPAVIDEVKFAAMVLVNACVGVVLDGEEVTDDGDPVTFGSEVLLGAMGVTKATEAVRRLYSSDFHVASAASTVLEAAGYGTVIAPEEEDEENPTTRSGRG